MSVLHIVLPVATMLLLAASSSQASAVYKWTDDKGVVQYTDAPPEGRKFERLDVRGASTQSAPTEENLPDVAGTEEEPNPAQQMRLTDRSSTSAPPRKRPPTPRSSATPAES
jgi:hypothetical protein